MSSSRNKNLKRRNSSHSYILNCDDDRRGYNKSHHHQKNDEKTRSYADSTTNEAPQCSLKVISDFYSDRLFSHSESKDYYAEHIKSIELQNDLPDYSKRRILTCSAYERLNSNNNDNVNFIVSLNKNNKLSDYNDDNINICDNTDNTTLEKQHKCRIVVLDMDCVRYAEEVAKRFSAWNIRGFVSYLKSNVSMDEMSEIMSKRGYLYVIFISGKNKKDGTVTLHQYKNNNILSKQSIAINKAIEDIRARSFNRKLTKSTSKEFEDDDNLLLDDGEDVHSEVENPSGRDLQNEYIQKILMGLVEKTALSIQNYDDIIKYIKKCRRNALQNTNGFENSPTNEEKHFNGISETNKKSRDDDAVGQHLQLNTILDTANKVELNYDINYSTMQDVVRDRLLVKLLRDRNIWKSLEMLLCSRTANTIQKTMKVSSVPS